MNIAVIAITKNGSALAGKIGDSYPGTDAYIPKRFITPGEGGVRPLKEDLKAEVARLFKRYDGLVFIMAAGIVVRMIAPLIKDKKTDPAVVVMDEGGKFAISLLSGHIGGANDLAKEMARITGGQAVITTASDTGGRLAVDTIAGMLDCVIEDFEAAKRVTAAIVNGGRVAAYSHIKPAVIKKKLGGADGITFYKSLEVLAGSEHEGAIIITPFMLTDIELAGIKCPVILRPRVLVAGIGCNRGTASCEIAGLLKNILNENNLSALSVRNLATIEEKKDEAGLNKFAKAQGLGIQYFPKSELLTAATPSGPSEKVYRNMGVYGVCEPAALLSAGAKRLLVAKTKSKNATLAIAEAALR